MAADKYSRKKSFGQRAKRLALKSVFCAAAASTAFNCYGAPENLENYAAITTTNPVSAPAITASGGADDRTAPRSCAMNGDPAQMLKNTPKLARDLAILEKLPLTGKHVYDIVTNPANDIRACLFPVPQGFYAAREFYQYQDRTLNIARTAPSNSYFHESFHATQDISARILRVYALTMRDAIIIELLQEATAVAYELVTQKEAESLHLTLSGPTDNTITTSDDPQNRNTFDTAYDAVLKQDAAMDAKTREAKALEAGGKAVVRRLMDQQDNGWRNYYASQAIKNANDNWKLFVNDGREKKPGYPSMRRDVYFGIGAVSSKINLTPEEFLEPDADKTIKKTFKDWNFTITVSTVAPRQNFLRFV